MKPIILLHGALGGADQLKKLSDALQENFEVHTLEFSGHGGGAFGSEFTINSLSVELSEFINAEKLDKPLVFGYSMGGYVALKLAASQPENIGDILCLGTKFDWSKESTERELRMLNPEKIEAKIPQFAEALKKRHHPNDWKDVMKRTAGLMLDLSDGTQLSEAELGAIKSRVKLCLGGKDTMVSKEETLAVSKKIQGSEFKILDGIPHPIEQVPVDLLKSLIDEFN